MKFIKKMNKQAEQKLIMSKLIILILIALVLLAVIIGIWKFDLIKRISNLFPDFEKQEEIKQLQEEENNVPVIERDRDHGTQYPIIRLHYTEGADDLFAFRWNPTLNSGTGDVQVVMNIGESTWVFGIRTSYISQQWLVNPDAFIENENLIFKDGTGLYDYEKNDVLKIMNSKGEAEMISRVSEAAKRDKVYIEFPQYNLNSWQYDDNIEMFDTLTKEEVQTKLKVMYPEYYKNEKN